MTDEATMPVPELWGAAQAAAYMGVSRTRIHQLAEAYPEDLPHVPVVGIDRHMRVWRAASWRKFRQMDRPTGRWVNGYRPEARMGDRYRVAETGDKPDGPSAHMTPA